MKRFRNYFLMGLVSLLLIVNLVGCSDDDGEENEVPEGSRAAYIVNGGAQTLSVFDMETSKITSDIMTIGMWPNDIKIKNGMAYVVNTGDNNIS